MYTANRNTIKITNKAKYLQNSTQAKQNNNTKQTTKATQSLTNK